MRPTFSIICFTVLSGIGYGAWFLIGLGEAVGPLCGAPGAPCTPMFNSFPGLPVAFACVSIGLVCSLGHLGKPARAWRALSQWRSSWLSREGVFALLTFVPAVALIALPWLDFYRMKAGALVSHGWWFAMGLPRLSGALLALGSLATVYCTANIYASLKPVRAWRDRHVLPAYLLLGLYGGILLLHASATLSGWRRDQFILLPGTIVLAGICSWIKQRYWRSIDAQPPVTPGRATGLEALGAVRAFEAPHTEENYLLHEMGFVLARKHARKLRTIALVAAFLVPAMLAALALALPAATIPAACIALASGIAGLAVERWLFFAEAKHAVMAYYRR